MSNTLGKVSQEDIDIHPYTLKGILANAAIGVCRIAAALERIAAVMEQDRP